MEEQREGLEAMGEANQPTEAESTNPMDGLLEQDLSARRLQRGEVVEGVVVKIKPPELLIDVGAKSEGVVSQSEVERMSPEALAELTPGTRVLAYVLRPDDVDGNIVLSLVRAEMEKDWREAERLNAAQEAFEGVVAGHNKGGLIVRLGKLRGFVPASQMAEGRFKRAENNEEAWAGLIGQKLQLRVVEIDRKRNRLILSERAAMREWRKEQKERLLSELKDGDVRRGTVSSVCDFGVFVDLGGADGLIHLSELAWGRMAHPREILKAGQEVEVYVLNVDRERRRIGLSLKRLQPEPWAEVERLYRIGQLVQGTITKLTSFGAFARIKGEGGDIEGLVHVSELADQRINHPKEVVHEGDVLTLRIIRIDSQRRRMGLSLKRVSDPEYADLDWRAEYAASLAAEAGDEDADLAPSEGEPDAPCEHASNAVPAEPEELEARERSLLS